MSCWVAPVIAAEMWKVSIQSIMDGIGSGSIPTQTKEGFTFVDIAPDGPRFEPPRAYQKENRPPTFVVVSKAELDALTEEPAEASVAVMADALAAVAESIIAEVPSCGVPAEDEAEMYLADPATASSPEDFMEGVQAQFFRDEQAEGSISNWRESRDRAGRLRVPPRSIAA